jgi:hypothetical protein
VVSEVIEVDRVYMVGGGRSLASVNELWASCIEHSLESEGLIHHRYGLVLLISIVLSSEGIYRCVLLL